MTGSARLDLYRFGGDSLQGRYFFVRLHPLSLAEVGGSADDLTALLTLGGFPEPFLGGSEARARRWSIEYRERLVREDIATLETIQNLGALELLVLRLPELVASPLSVNALREDLPLNHQTVARWLDVLERTYAIFRVAPFGAPRIRAVKKKRKHYGGATSSNGWTSSATPRDGRSSCGISATSTVGRSISSWSKAAVR